MRTPRSGLAILLVLIVNAAANSYAQWHSQESHTNESLRGISAVSQDIAWASGTHGTYLRTIDGGLHWTASQVAGAEALDFRDVKAFSASTAYLLAAGPGDQSRIYKTSTGGERWELQFTNPEPKGFLDCMAFWDTEHGIAVGDPVNGKFQIVATEDGGKRWTVLAPQMPEALPDEGAFAASGSCIATQGARNAWFVTGGAAARVFRSHDRGRSWQATPAPISHSVPSAGIFSIAFHDAKHGVIAGGDYKQPEQGGANLAMTSDGGKSWRPVRIGKQSYFSAIAYIPGGLIAVGLSVAAVSHDGLKSWDSYTSDGFNAVSSRGRAMWAVGGDGKVSSFKFQNK